MSDKGEWISVEDELPDDAYPVLVYIKLWEGQYDILMGYFDGGWYSMNDNMIFSGVTHWMPLPDPPEVDDDHSSS